MTTLFPEVIQCSVCGAENTFEIISSTNTFGSPDLDTRPAEMQRSTIRTWVQRCPNCGYCAADISETYPKAQTVVNCQEYKAQFANPIYPELANSFLCKAIVDHESNDYVDATWALIHAAWVCDDANQPDQARICRQKAVDMLKIAEQHGQQLSEQEGANTAILVDLLRRSGQLEKARELVVARREHITEEVIAHILDFQSRLINKNDCECHTISEALHEMFNT